MNYINSNGNPHIEKLLKDLETSPFNDEIKRMVASNCISILNANLLKRSEAVIDLAKSRNALMVQLNYLKHFYPKYLQFIKKSLIDAATWEFKNRKSIPTSK